MRRELFRLPGSARHHPAVERWMAEHTSELGPIAQHWFDVIRQ